MSKKLGARISVATLTAQLVLGSLSFGLMPTVAMAAKSTTTTITSSPNASNIGQSVTLTATVEGNGGPSGTVDFFVNNVEVVSNVTLSGNGGNSNQRTATTTWTFNAGGAYTLKAKYDGLPGSGNSGFDPSTSVNYTHNVNASPVDTDGDGFADGSDNCPSVFNNPQTNTDGDSMGDACDTDDDGDGVADVGDNCPLNVNADQLNTDGMADGGNACDTDDDDDGDLDGADNCPLVANGDQTNTDGAADGGDACDTDDDNDTVLDGADNCPLVANTVQTDTDGDGAGNACENEGYIKVAKQTNPDGNATVFTFTGDIATTLSDGQTSAVVSVAPGAHTVTESAAEGWLLTGISCDDANSTGDTGTRTATYNVVDDEIVTCTFTNTLGASLTVIKTVVNDDGGSADADDFQLNLTIGEAVPTEFAGNVSGTVFSLTPGIEFSVTEDAYEDYTMTGLSGDCTEITPVAGGEYLCTVTNDDDSPTITVTKEVVDAEDGAKLPTAFSLFVDDGDDQTTVVTGATNEFAVGTYSVGEVDDIDYDPSFGGACTATGQLTLAFGDNAACTITNTAVFVEVCQVNPGNTHTIYLRPSEVEDHLAAQEEDYLGPCDGDEGEGEHEGSTLVCHHGSDKWVNDSAVGAHLGHGDTLGSCDGGGEGEDPVCGNGDVEEGETCDDGETNDGDGCSEICEVEQGYECTGEPSVCELDDVPAHCGNGMLQTPTGEVCDDGNNTPGDGCSAACTVEEGYECTDTPMETSVCTATTGGIRFHKYLCSGVPTLSREINGPTASGLGAIPESCEEQSGVSFGYIYQADKDDTSPPYPGLDDETPFTAFAGSTNGSGILNATGLSTDGRYMVAETDGSDLLAFYCYGDGGTGTNNYEAVFVEGGATIHCVAYNHKEVVDDGDSDDDGVVDEDDNCVEVPNGDQDDDDGDDIGNVCDETPNGTGPGNSENSNGNDQQNSGSSNGARRGQNTNVFRSLVSLFGGENDAGDVPPGGFGGPGEEEFTEEEAALICKLRKAIIAIEEKQGIIKTTNVVYQQVAADIAKTMPHSMEAILAELTTGSICPQQEVSTAPKAAKPIAFRVDAAGYPVSSNETWNKCIRGTVTLADIRNNPDRDEDGFGYGCGRYHTGPVWSHPDHAGVYFTWKSLTKSVTLPSGYAVKKDAVLTQK